MVPCLMIYEIYLSNQRSRQSPRLTAFLLFLKKYLIYDSIIILNVLQHIYT